MIWGTSGKPKSGKDTIGKVIQYLVCERDKKLNEKLVPFSELNETDDWWLGDSSRWCIDKFAEIPKQHVAQILGVNRYEFEKHEFKDALVESRWVGEGGYRPTNRQFFADYCNKLREFNPDIWVNALFNEIDKQLSKPENKRYYNHSIITDVRFENEAQSILDRNGILIRVNRPSLINDDELGVEEFYECELDHYSHFTHTIINQGGIENLIEQVREILIRENVL